MISVGKKVRDSTLNLNYLKASTFELDLGEQDQDQIHINLENLVILTWAKKVSGLIVKMPSNLVGSFQWCMNDTYQLVTHLHVF